jgi:hypothetical protein
MQRRLVLLHHISARQSDCGRRRCARLFGQVPESPLSELNVRSQPATTIERPRCQECRLDMWLLTIKPAQPGQELRTFQCARCGAEQTLLCADNRR